MVWYILPTFVFFMWMCFKLHLRTIYCDKSTVEETRLSEIAILSQVCEFLLDFLVLNNKPQPANFLLICSNTYEVYSQ